MTDSSTQPATTADAQPDKAGQTSPAKVDKSGHPADIDRERVKAQVQGLIAETVTEDDLCKALMPVIDGVLCRSAAPLRAKVCKAIAGALRGEHWGNALDAAGLGWATMLGMRGAYPAFTALWEVIQPICEQSCKQRRIRLADNRAFQGLDRPVFQGGKLVGHVREYSDRLAELLIVGDDRARYGREGGRGAGQGGGGAPVAIQINVVTADRSATSDNPAAPAINITP